jgi:alcohol dehydrogenase class IV
MSERFDYRTSAPRIVFGASQVAVVADVVRELGCSRALVVSGPSQTPTVDLVAGHLGSSMVVRFGEATLHTPIAVTTRALAMVNLTGADCLVAVGGGSAIGLAKALALRTALPIVAIPTTYAGSEMTNIVGETEGGTKTTRRDPAVLPKAVIYDVSLTLSLPPQTSGASGMNALAHAVEALWARDANPITSALATQAITLLGRSLPLVVADGTDLDARDDCLIAALCAGWCLGGSEMSLHHRMCHVLGGMFNLPHAETHAVLLPYVIAYNAPAAPRAVEAIADALGVVDAASGVADLASSLGRPRGLCEIGMPSDGIAAATAAVVGGTGANPRPLDRAGVESLIAAAFSGATLRPSSSV